MEDDRIIALFFARSEQAITELSQKYGRRLLQVLENAGIPYEHMPSGVDSQCVVVKEHYRPKEIERKIVQAIRENLEPDFVTIERDLTMLMIVGEGMCYTPGMLAKACLALASAGISLSMVNQGSSEVSFMLAIRSQDRDMAVRALYKAFFGYARLSLIFHSR